jgi:hypothetical protein
MLTALGFDFCYSYILLLGLLFFLLKILLLLNNSNFYQKTSHILVFISILIFIFIVELYQFYYILTIFLQGVMTFDENAGE